MDTSSLVRDKFDDGQRLLLQLVRDGFDVTIAFWVRFQFEEVGPFFYIASKVVDEKGLHAAYLTLHESLHRIPIPWRSWNSVAEITELRLISTDDPVVCDVLAVRDQYPGRNRFRGIYIGNQLVEELVFYQYDLPRILLAIIELGSAKVGVEFPYMRGNEEPWSSSAQKIIALETLRRELGCGIPILDEWIRRIDIGPESIPVKELLRQLVESVYPLIFPTSASNREQDEARAFEKLGPVFWGLKAEVERQGKQLGNEMLQPLRQIWPESEPKNGANALRQVSEPPASGVA